MTSFCPPAHESPQPLAGAGLRRWSPGTHERGDPLTNRRGGACLGPVGAMLYAAPRLRWSRRPLPRRMNVVVIGITGRNCAGKDTVADVLEARGFERHSLSDAIREDLRSRGVEITRSALIGRGRELRELEGPAVLADRMKRLMRTERVALISVRSPAEVESLRALPGFTLLSVDAPIEVRFDRELGRSREGAVRTLAEFVELERREDTTDPNAQQLAATLTLADHHIVNADSLADLEAQVARLLEDIDA